MAATDTLPVSRKIEAMSDFVTLKLSQSSDVERIGVITPGLDIRLSPNVESATRLGFSYRFISFGIRFAPKLFSDKDDDALKGKTRSGGFNVGFNFRHWIQELSYTRTKGYYLENTPEVDPTWTPDSPYIQFPGLSFTQYEGSTAYNFNPDFSVNAIVTQSERQLKSAGSFIPVLFYRYYINDHKTPPEPGGFNQRGDNLELLLGAGYHYNFVLKEKFYFALGLTPAAGYVFSRITNRYETYSESGRQRNFIFRLDGRAGIGYNSQRFFTGIYMRFAESAYREEKTSVIVENDRTIFHAVIGFRLNAPSWIKKPVDAVSRTIGIK
ncbi:DUF4421 family protein [Pseudobacter ginsenosidimutans]|nr:DUF4421 family protein [Pseudobacter ginsenosidimutans]